MNAETFNKLLDELDNNSLETLKQRNAKYASPDDCLHNFESGAEVMGNTPAQCAWGYMTKHLTALRDKVQKNDFSDREDLLEKCQDIINYIRFIWLIGNETQTEQTMNKIVEDLTSIYEPTVLKGYNPVEQAYKVLEDIHYNKSCADATDYSIAVEEAIGYLGEALDD